MDLLAISLGYFTRKFDLLIFSNISNNIDTISKFTVELKVGPPRGFGDLGRRAIYFQGAGEHC